MKTLIFRALPDPEGKLPRDGGHGYDVLLDGKTLFSIRGDEAELGGSVLDPLWQALGITLLFDEE